MIFYDVYVTFCQKRILPTVFREKMRSIVIALYVWQRKTCPLSFIASSTGHESYEIWNEFFAWKRKEVNFFFSDSERSKLGFEVFVSRPYVNNSGNGGLHVRVVLVYKFSKARGLSPLSDAFFNADYDELIKKLPVLFGGSRPHFSQILTSEPKNAKCENNNRWGPNKCQMMIGFKTWSQHSNRKHLTPF